MAKEKKFNPDLSDVLVDEDGNQVSRYSLVIATAKLANKIVDEAVADDAIEVIQEKPVTTALNKILEGEYGIEEPGEIRNL